jgi:hypothetical protein
MSAKADGGGQVALAGAGRAEQQQIGAVVDPAVAGGERHHLRLGDDRDSLEVEAVEGLADGQAGFGEMALDAPAAAVGHLVLGERRKQACGGPAFLVRLRDNRCPHGLDGRQAQLDKHQFEPRAINGDGAAHGVTCGAAAGRMVASSS